MTRPQRTISLLLLCAVTVSFAGCGSASKTKTVTVERATKTASIKSKAPTTTTTTDANNGEPADADDSSQIIPPALEPKTPQNLRATDRIRSDLVTAGNVWMRTHSHEMVDGALQKTQPGSLYLARWAGHEYAFASFVAPSEFDVAGSFYREVGRQWIATDVGAASDVGPACAHPSPLLRLWFDKTLLSSCRSDADRLITIPGGVECTAAGSGATAKLTCGTLDAGYDSKDLEQVTTLDAQGHTGSGVNRHFAEGAADLIYGATIAGFNVPTPVTAGGVTWTCTSVPARLVCAGPAGGVITLRDKG